MVRFFWIQENRRLDLSHSLTLISWLSIWWVHTMHPDAHLFSLSKPPTAEYNLNPHCINHRVIISVHRDSTAATPPAIGSFYFSATCPARGLQQCFKQKKSAQPLSPPYAEWSHRLQPRSPRQLSSSSNPLHRPMALSCFEHTHVGIKTELLFMQWRGRLFLLSNST